MLNEEPGDAMNAARFTGLAAIYGGNFARWPVAERTRARWFATRHPLSCRRILHDARALDRVLAKSRAPAVSALLHARISQRALAAQSGVEFGRWLRRAWLSAGLATACAAGIATGFVVTPHVGSAAYGSVGADPVEDAAAALREPSDLGEA